jgi:hypothetical protein
LKNKFAPIFFFYLTSAGNGQHWSVNSFTSLYWQPSGCQLFPFHQPSPALAFKSCLHWQPTGCQFYSCNQRWPCQRWLYPCFTGTSAGLQSQRWFPFAGSLRAASIIIYIYIYIYINKYFKYTVYFFNVNPVLFILDF